MTVVRIFNGAIPLSFAAMLPSFAAVLLLFAPVLFVAGFTWAQQGGDSQAQIVYAYQTEDTNRLVNLIQDLTTQVKDNPGDVSLRYHLAHAEYRRGLLAGASNARAAEIAFADCIDELKPVLSQNVNSVEALALESACYASLASYRKLESVLLRSRAAERLEAALALEPQNPRAVYLLGMKDLRQAKPGSAESKRALSELERAAQLFEASSATSADAPCWGHAEAYLALGQELQSRGDRLGARNWIEKSLIAAPDYKAAQRQLALLVRH
jgi:tetratricopeptide (TPR) repeat protein